MISALIFAVMLQQPPLTVPGVDCESPYAVHILRDPWHRPRWDDPAVLASVLRGMDRHSARVARAVEVVNGCD